MIVGKRVCLRAIEYEDLPLMVEWRNDPEVYRHFYEQEPLSMAMQKRWFEAFLNKDNEKLWIIEAIDGSVPIGTAGLVHIDWRSRKAEYGRLLIYPAEYRGGGYGREVEDLILSYAFDHMNLHRIYCEVFADNEHVISMHERSGFTIEGRFKRHVFKDGEYRDIVYMALLRDKYLRIKGDK